MAPEVQTLLTDVLKGVSRSFYLSLQFLPWPLREPFSIGYLLARSADTIADTRLIPLSQRAELLELLKREILDEGDSPGTAALIRRVVQPSVHPVERVLIEKLPLSLELLREKDGEIRNQLNFVLSGLIDGMQADLREFPGESAEQLRTFETLSALDAYTYRAAGIVGEFWTNLCLHCLPSLFNWDPAIMRQGGIRFGKGLQLVNILKDTSRDLRIGRCYYPLPLLDLLGLSPGDLLSPRNIVKLRPALNHLAQMALDHFEVAREYILAIPRRETRLRLCCIWPLWIGLKTLSLLAASDRLLDPSVNVRISRQEVYGLMRRSLGAVWFDSLIDGYTKSFRDEVLQSIEQGWSATKLAANE